MHTCLYAHICMDTRVLSSAMLLSSRTRHACMSDMSRHECGARRSVPNMVLDHVRAPAIPTTRSPMASPRHTPVRGTPLDLSHLWSRPRGPSSRGRVIFSSYHHHLLLLPSPLPLRVIRSPSLSPPWNCIHKGQPNRYVSLYGHNGGSGSIR